MGKPTRAATGQRADGPQISVKKKVTVSERKHNDRAASWPDFTATSSEVTFRWHGGTQTSDVVFVSTHHTSSHERAS